MLRAIGGVIVGYIVMFVVVMATFTGLYLVLKTDGSFKTGTYDVSTMWIVVSSVLSLVAAIAGGLVCAMIAKGGKAPMVLAGIVLVLGLLMAIPTFTAADDADVEPRPAEVDNWTAMSKAKTPPIAAILNPIIGAVGVMIGARMKGKAKATGE